MQNEKIILHLILKTQFSDIVLAKIIEYYFFINLNVSHIYEKKIVKKN